MRIFKKKLSILLSLLLAVLFISLLSTTSYAKTLTRQEIINFIYNGYEYHNDSEPDSTFKDSIENVDFTSWIAASDTYEGQWYISYSSNTQVHFGYYYGSATNMNLYCPYIYNNGISVNTSYLTRKRSALSLSNMTISSFNNYDTNLRTNEYFFYTDTNIYSTGTKANATIIYPAGYETINDIFGGGINDYFTFLLNSNLNRITINGDSVPYFEHNTNQTNTFVLGELGLAENFYNAELFTYRWQQGSWKLQNIRTLNNIGPTTSNLIEVTIRGDWINPNTLYSLQMNPYPDSEFAPYSQPFFVKNRYTSITNGALDLDNTFSGDYYNNYNNDTNTQDIIDNTNDNAQIDSIVNSELSGDINDFANKLNYSPIANPFLSVIEFVLNGVCTTLLGSGSQTLTFTMHGRSYTISSDDIVLPGGIFATFISGMLVAFYLYAFYKYGFHVYEKIQSGEFTSVIKNISNSNDNDEMRRL